MAMSLRESDVKCPRGKGKLAALLQELADKYHVPFNEVVRLGSEVLENDSKRFQTEGAYRAA